MRTNKGKTCYENAENAIIKDGEMCIIIFICANVLQCSDTSFGYHIKSLSVLPHTHMSYKLAYLFIRLLTHRRCASVCVSTQVLTITATGVKGHKYFNCTAQDARATFANTLGVVIAVVVVVDVAIQCERMLLFSWQPQQQ